jgi:hypothetical protein
MSNRVLWEVVPHWFGTLGWRVTVKRPGQERITEVRFTDKAMAVAYAVAACTFWLKSMKEVSSLRIKNHWGRIQEERSYGSDPSPPRG